LILDDLGLLAACEFLAEGASRRTGVSVIVRGSAGDRLPQDIETAVYRVVQEALTNATRHARAQLVMIDFERRQRTLAGEIRDDGIGFDTRRLLSGPSKSLGLSGICERLSAVGGWASIDSNPGGGTRIRFEVPLEA
jgi:signal transduction histidine kinase